MTILWSVAITVLNDQDLGDITQVEGAWKLDMESGWLGR